MNLLTYMLDVHVLWQKYLVKILLLLLLLDYDEDNKKKKIFSIY